MNFAIINITDNTINAIGANIPSKTVVETFFLDKVFVDSTNLGANHKHINHIIITVTMNVIKEKIVSFISKEELESSEDFE